MYSLVLMMAMTQPADAPQGIIFERGPVGGGFLFGGGRRGGCSGAQAQQQLATGRNGAQAALATQTVLVQATVGAGCNGAASAERRRLFGRLAERRHSCITSSGCAGTLAAAPAQFAAECSGTRALLLPQAAAGCGGGGVALTTLAQTGPLVLGSRPTTVTLTPAGATNEIGGGRLVTRVGVHRQLKKALRQGDLNQDQLAFLDRDPDAYDTAVSEAHKIVLQASRNAAAPGGQPSGAPAPATVGAIGDGHILQMLLANLPAIIAAIKQVLALFGH